MKQRLLISLFVVFLCPVLSMASAWDRHWWRMAVMQNGDVSPALLLYFAVEDTTVNGVGYFRIEDDSYLPGREADYPIKLPYGYRMADRKIYIYDFDNHKETVGFDFNLSVGDRFTTYNGMQWEVLGAKDTLVNISTWGTGENVSKRLLTVRTLDGKKTDQWLEDFGSFTSRLMIRNLDNVKLSHTLWMVYTDKMLVRDISADPFYAHASKRLDNDEDVGDGDVYDIYSTFSYEEGVLSLVNEQVTYGHRFYSCFYREGDELYRIGSEEIGPALECALSLKIDSFTFAGVPAPASGAYTLHVDNDTYSTGIRPAIVSPKHTKRYIYDLQGRQLPAKPKTGLYIMDGVKYNAR